MLRDWRALNCFGSRVLDEDGEEDDEEGNGDGAEGDLVGEMGGEREEVRVALKRRRYSRVTK